MRNLSLHFGLLALLGCGDLSVRANLASESQQAIIGGEPSAVTDYPAVGVLLVSGSGGFFGDFASMACTGTLVTPDTVLLASHCLDESVYYGAEVTFHFSFATDVTTYGVDTLDLPENSYPVLGSATHPDFTMEAFERNVHGPGVYHDVALAFLGRPVTDREPAMVMAADDAEAVAVGAEVDIVGYGIRSADYDPWGGNPEDSGVKYHATSFINEVGAAEMQIGDVDPAPQKCHGDSGGPTFLEYDDGHTPTRRLIGITSHAYDESDCARGGVDTRVDAYRDWIAAEMLAACDGGVRITCGANAALPEPVELTPPPPPENPTLPPTNDEEVRITSDSSRYYDEGCSQAAPGAAASVLLLVAPLWFWRRRRPLPPH